MNVSHRYKLVWWATSRCASRFTSYVLSPLQFYNYDENEVGVRKLRWFDLIFEDDGQNLEYGAFSHKLQVPEVAKGYDIVMNARNPYDVFYSNYRLQNMEYVRGKNDGPIDESDIKITFEEWAMGEIENHRKHQHYWQLSDYKIKDISNVKYIIRYESLYGDIMKLPFVSELYHSNTTYKTILDGSFSEPYGGFRGGLPYQNQTFRDVYTEEIADFIYTKYKLQFDILGYGKDSWKK